MVRSHIGNVVCPQGIERSSRFLSAKDRDGFFHHGFLFSYLSFIKKPHGILDPCGFSFYEC